MQVLIALHVKYINAEISKNVVFVNFFTEPSSI